MSSGTWKRQSPSPAISKGWPIAIAVAIAMIAMPAAAQAVLPGNNGNILFVSGQNEASDATAKLYLRLTTGTFGGAPNITGPLDASAGQHRHPTWSPDRTKIAYARGGSSCNPKCDIFILDLTTPGAAPQNITNTANVNEDRPAWSPDGTRIAFESEVTDASGQLDILVDSEPFGSGPNLNLTNTGGAGQFESKPAWSPDSQTLYYGRGNVGVAPGLGEANSANIYREPADNSGAPALAVANVDPLHHFQPSISPDGNRICYTLMTGPFGGTDATVMVGDLTTPPTAGNVLANDPAGNYNCTWSPNGTQVAYVQGTFSNGDLVMKNLNNPLLTIPLVETPARFDGNPDWAPDGRPRCEDTSVATTFNTPVSIPLECADTGPAYEQTPVRAIGTEPPNGTIAPEVAQELPASVTYTPNPGFSGTDSFTVTSFDAAGFGDREGVVTINVSPPNEVGPPSNLFSFVKVKKNKRKGTAKLTLKVPGPGDLKLAKSRKVKADKTRADAAGNVKLVVRARGAAKRKLAARGRIRVRAKVTYAPDNGDPRTKSRRIKLKRR